MHAVCLHSQQRTQVRGWPLRLLTALVVIQVADRFALRLYTASNRNNQVESSLISTSSNDWRTEMVQEA